MNIEMGSHGRPSLALALALSLMAPSIAEAGKKERAIALGIGIGMLGGALASNGDPERSSAEPSRAASSAVSPTRIDWDGGKTAARGATTTGTTDDPDTTTGAENPRPKK